MLLKMLTLLTISFILSASADENEESVLPYKKRYLEFETKYRRQMELLRKDPKFSGKVSEIGLTDAAVMSTSGDRVGDIIVANVHGDVTLEALTGKTSKDCLKRIVDENTKQDRGEEDKLETNHFDNNSICPSWKIVQDRLAEVQNEKSRSKQLHLVGAVFHALQDFYSHSNYLEASLAKIDSLNPDDVILFDFDAYCRNPKSYKDLGEVFTGTYRGDHGRLKNWITDEDLADPYSHLHWNKDFSPHSNSELARIYARSSLKKSRRGNGPYYFDFVWSMQKRETATTFDRIVQKTPALGAACKL